MRLFANIFSYLFHPLLMATYGCLIIFFGLTETIYFVFTPLRIKIVLIITVFSFTFLLPVLNLLILYKLGYVSSIKVENRQERTLPLILTSFCYFGLFYMIYDFSIWPAVKILILGGGVCIFLAALINFWWQISTHMIGIGGLIGVLLAICFYVQTSILIPISVGFILAGFIAFSRLQLKAHTPAQVYSGFLFGCIIQFSLFYLSQSITFV